MSIRHSLSLALALLPGLAPSLAAADPAAPGQVAIESRFIEVQAEFLMDLGVAFNPVDAHYRSTGAQEPADTSHTGTSGSGGGGLNVMAVVSPDGDGPLGAGPAAVGVGVQAEGFYESLKRVLGLVRHHPPDEPDDVTAARDVESAVDLTATARIPFATVPRVGGDGRIILALQPLVGATFTHVETKLRSDQTFFGGEDLRAKESETKAGVVAGVGLTAEIPLLKDIPVLAGLFYKARRVPGSSVELESTFGFTESVAVDSAWQHSVSLMVIVPITLASDPFDMD